jgi:putative spermidine/putrescine transport system substrate-binding protein
VRAARAPAPGRPGDAANRLDTTVLDAIHLGDHWRLVVRLAGAVRRRCHLVRQAAARRTCPAIWRRASPCRWPSIPNTPGCLQPDAPQVFNRGESDDDQEQPVVHTLAALAVLTLAATAAHAQRDMTVVSVGRRLPGRPEGGVLQALQRHSAPSCVDEAWDGGLGVLRTKIKGGNNTWDVVQVEADELEVGCDEGLYEKLDVSQDRRRQRATCRARCTPAASARSSTTWCWPMTATRPRPRPAAGPTSSTARNTPGKRAIRNGAKWNLEVALIADGVPSKDVYKVLRTPEGVERAFKKLDTIKPDLVFWKSGAQPPQMLAAGDVVFTTAYNGRITAANEKDKKNFKMVWKDTPYTMDSWVIMKGTPNKANAEKLVEFLGRRRAPGQAAEVRALRRHRRRLPRR